LDETSKGGSFKISEQSTMKGFPKETNPQTKSKCKNTDIRGLKLKVHPKL
jgi:hypothetical protein